jgi:hypothetical protein
VTSPDRVSFGLVIAGLLCCAAPVLLGTGLATAAWGVVRHHWGWLAAGAGVLAAAGLLRAGRAGSGP